MFVGGLSLNYGKLMILRMRRKKLILKILIIMYILNK